MVRIDELDAIVTQSVGLRWAVGGPFHRSTWAAATAACAASSSSSAPGMEKRWQSMSDEVRFDEATTQLLFEQADAAFGRHTREALEADADARQIAILQALAAEARADTMGRPRTAADPRARWRTGNPSPRWLRHPRRTCATCCTGVGLAPRGQRRPIAFEGRDPICPSVFRIARPPASAWSPSRSRWPRCGACAAAQGQDIALDLRNAPHRLCPFYDRKWELLNGYPPRNTADPDSPFTLTFYETRDGRWVMPLNLYPQLRSSALRLLGCSRRPEGGGAGDPRLGRAPSWSRPARAPAS